MDELSDVEREILRFEDGFWKYAGAKEAAVLERFGMTATRYAQVVGALVDRPAAVAAEPLVVGRLVRLRERRKAARTARAC